MINPVMYSGKSCKNKTAKENIKNGPTIQVIKKEVVSSFGFSNIFGTCEKSIFVNGGYIININPMANGILVVPEENELIKSDELGIK
jgi:hypothetical protein